MSPSKRLKIESEFELTLILLVLFMGSALNGVAWVGERLKELNCLLFLFLFSLSNLEAQRSGVCLQSPSLVFFFPFSPTNGTLFLVVWLP